MADLPRSEVLRLTAKLAGLDVYVFKRRFFVEGEVSPEWNPYDNCDQFERLMEEAKISLDYDDDRDEWVARRAAHHVTWYKSRTEAGLQCAARVEMAKEGK